LAYNDFSKGKDSLIKLFRPRSWNQIFTILFFLIVIIEKKIKDRQNKDGTKMEREKMKEKKIGERAIKLLFYLISFPRTRSFNLISF
jgi:hypothetical protein